MSDWIKMRSALLQAPKLIAMGRVLHGHRPFRDWLAPGNDRGAGPLVSDDALRCVTSSLLLRVWSSSREHGKFIGDDLFLACITIADLDVMAGVEGFGEAMRKVGWAIEKTDGSGVVLPNFKEHNVPKTSAERQQASRDRKSAAKARHAASHDTRNAKTRNVAPRGEERREEKKEESPIGDSCPEGSPPANPPGQEASAEILMVFPTSGNGPRTWGLTDAKVREWEEAFPAVGVAQECRKALQWVRDNPAKAKTAAGMPRFLWSWLERAQNRGGSPRVLPGGVPPPGRAGGRSDNAIDYMAQYGGQE